MDKYGAERIYRAGVFFAGCQEGNANQASYKLYRRQLQQIDNPCRRGKGLASERLAAGPSIQGADGNHDHRLSYERSDRASETTAAGDRPELHGGLLRGRV